jgi:hypothetical protein
VNPLPNRMDRVVATGSCSCSSVLLQLTAQQPATTLPDVQTLGPQIGARPPEFTLLDQKGQSRTLSSLMATEGTSAHFAGPLTGARTARRNWLSCSRERLSRRRAVCTPVRLRHPKAT